MALQHVAIDGSLVTLSGNADWSRPVTTTGWAMVPALMKAHPFMVVPPGYAAALEQIAGAMPSIKIESRSDFQLRDGTLHVATATLPMAPGGTRAITVAIWAGKTACLSTSFRGADAALAVEAFQSLEFGPRRNGLAVHTQVMARPRAPELIKAVPGVGILSLRPAIPSELERVPKARGAIAEGGELFRIRRGSDAMLLVTPSCIAAIQPEAGANRAALLELGRSLTAEWAPPSSRAA